MNTLRLLLLIVLLSSCTTRESDANTWSDDPVWHDGLVEKATYTASRVIYAQPRAYEAIFFTNKEQHDRKTLTKAEKSTDLLEVWKFNQVEVIPTPNYDYKFVTTSHLAVTNMQLTRLDCSSQEFCGTSFKQYLRRPGERAMSYWGFSYMPEAGRVEERYGDSDRPIVAEDSLALYLRGYDFDSRRTMLIGLLPSQKSNRAARSEPLNAMISFVTEEPDAYKLQLIAETGRQGGTLLGTYWMAKDRLHIMLRYEGADGQRYELTDVERVDYWTIRQER